MIDVLNPLAAEQMTAAFGPFISGQLAVINQTAGNVAARAFALSPVASPAKIERDLLRRVTVTPRGNRQPYTIPRANLIVRRRGQTPEDNERAARRLIARKKGAAGWSRSGWAHATRDINRVTRKKNPVPGNALRTPPTGYTIPARDSKNLVAVIRNNVVLHGPRARAAEAKRTAAFQRALREESPKWNRAAQANALATMAKIK